MSGDHDEAGVSKETFLELIRQRTEELNQKTELTRLQDLKRIQEMKSRDGMSPNEMFPEEIWRLIFSLLTPEDRRNMWCLHDTFRDIMKDSHVRDNLFPQILHFEVKESQRMGGPLSRLHAVKQPLAHHFLELRKVSKIMRDAVDRVIQEDLLKVMRERRFSVCEKPRKTFSLLFYDLSTSDGDFDKLDRLITFTEDNSTMLKRFIPRSLNVELDILNDNPNFPGQFEQLKNKISRFLNHSGKDILHFSFEATQIARDGLNRFCDLYLALMQWLSLMPNLKWLQLQFHFFDRLNNSIDMEILEGCPPPKLEGLQRLDFSQVTPAACQTQIQSVCTEMLVANPHVTILHIDGVYNVLPSGGLPQLETFGVCYRAKPFIWINPIDWSSLKRLDLLLDGENGSIASVLLFLNQFSSLEKLSLKLQNVAIGEGIEFLELPNLKEFHFLTHNPEIDYKADASIHFFFSLQFLLHCKNLRRLMWEWTKSTEVGKIKEHLAMKNVDAGKMIEFGSGFGDLANSNIWKVFPCLEYIKVSNRLDENTDGNVKLQIRTYRKRELTSVVSF